MTDNFLTRLSQGLFEGNERIRKLWLGGNPIDSLDGFVFPTIPHLRILDLSNCRISKLGKDTFAFLDLLEVLQLNGNRFRRLDREALEPLAVNLKSLTLEGNPWACDCRLKGFWRWLKDSKSHLITRQTACQSPKKLRGVRWHDLDILDLSCPPRIVVPEPMVTASSGGVVRLACLVSEMTPRTELRWVRSGAIIANNSRSANGIVDGATQYFTVYESRLFQPRRKWFNLTIENVHPSGSGHYTCVARNFGGGGIAEGNVTVVYSESVATYLDKSEMSTLLLAIGVGAGFAVFVVLGFAIVCVVLVRKERQRHRRSHQHITMQAVQGQQSLLTAAEAKAPDAAHQRSLLLVSEESSSGKSGVGGNVLLPDAVDEWPNVNANVNDEALNDSSAFLCAEAELEAGSKFK